MGLLGSLLGDNFSFTPNYNNFHIDHTIQLKEICLKIVGYISCNSVKRNNNYNNKSVTVNK